MQLFMLYLHRFCLLLLLGVKPNSEFLRDSRIQLDSKNFVIVDKVSWSPVCSGAYLNISDLYWEFSLHY